MKVKVSHSKGRIGVYMYFDHTTPKEIKLAAEERRPAYVRLYRAGEHLVYLMSMEPMEGYVSRILSPRNKGKTVYGIQASSDMWDINMPEFTVRPTTLTTEEDGTFSCSITIPGTTVQYTPPDRPTPDYQIITEESDLETAWTLLKQEIIKAEVDGAEVRILPDPDEACGYICEISKGWIKL